ncbi:MAG: hypothetical protein ACYTBJ_07010 [Planctomycetota bacterium]
MEFQVFKNGEVVDDFELHGAYLFGTDGIAIRKAHVMFHNGVVTCRKPNLETAGLALLWPVDGFGRVLLPTTCLPEKSSIYNLNVEMARAKLMQIINKREDWLYFDSLGDLEGLSKDAKDLLVRAIQNMSDTSLASRLGDESLQKAMVLSEQLAMKQAESHFKARVKSRGFSRGCFGCRVDPGKIADGAYLEKIMELFGFVTVPVTWADIEPFRGSYDFSKIDACISILGKRKLAICVGPLLRFSEDCLPRWLQGGRASFEKVRDAAYQLVRRVVARYSGGVQAWRVISGLNAFNHFGFSFQQVLEMTRAACMAVRATNDRAVRMIEVTNPWGEYYAGVPNTIPPLVYVDMVVQSGISFEAFGLQMRFGKNESGMHVRDMMQISSVLDYFGSAGKPLYVTDVEVPSEGGDAEHKPDAAGIWHQEWDPAQQSCWIEHFYKIAFSKPFVETVTYSSLADTAETVIANSGLLTGRFEAKESFLSLKKLRALIFGR